jgi:hypothetical protein
LRGAAADLTPVDRPEFLVLIAGGRKNRDHAGDAVHDEPQIAFACG